MDPLTQVGNALNVLQLSTTKPQTTHNQLTYEPVPSYDSRILRLLKLAPGSSSDALVGTLQLSAGVGPSDETRPPDEGFRSLGVSQAVADAVQARREAEAATAAPEASCSETLVEYEALSYVWGDPARTESMTLNGTPFGISANLEAALVRLRLPDAERTLWVDAICINQDDEAEKRREVMRMRAIYNSAKQVVVWLGEASLDSNLAIEWAKQIYLQFTDFLKLLGRPEHGEGSFDWISGRGLLEMVERLNLLLPYHVSSWKALHRLLSRPWFGRAWTLQELIMARSSVVLCGERTVKWEVIELAIDVCDVTYNQVHELVDAPLPSTIFLLRPPPSIFLLPRPPYHWPPYYLDYLKRLSGTRRKYRFFGLRNLPSMFGKVGFVSRCDGASSRLMITASRNCFLAHDKIYSVLGILSAPLRDALTQEMDYSISARTAFLRAVRTLVLTTRWLNIICHSHYSPWYPPDHPSWLPDWTRMPRSSVLAERNYDAVMPPHRVVCDREAEASFSEDLRTLTAKGFVVARVQTVGLENELLTLRDERRVERTSRYLACGSREEAVIWRETLYPKDPEFQYIPNTNIPEEGHESDPNYFDFELPLRVFVGPRLLSERPNGSGDVLDRFLEGLHRACGLLAAVSDNLHTAILNSEALDFCEEFPSEREADFMECYKKVRGHMNSRTLFTRDGHNADRGMMGMGPDFTAPGDLVCVLFGCDAPVILREKEGEEGKFMFIGDAHVQGFMDEEGIEGLEEGRYELVDFRIV